MDHRVCDAWPVRRQTYGYLPSRRASPPLGRYQIILLGDRGTWVWTTCPELLLGSGLAGSWARPVRLCCRAAALSTGMFSTLDDDVLLLLLVVLVTVLSVGRRGWSLSSRLCYHRCVLSETSFSSAARSSSSSASSAFRSNRLPSCTSLAPCDFQATSVQFNDSMPQLRDRMTEQICRQWKRTKRHQSALTIALKLGLEKQ